MIGVERVYVRRAWSVTREMRDEERGVGVWEWGVGSGSMGVIWKERVRAEAGPKSESEVSEWNGV